jgi:hypothetical protein
LERSSTNGENQAPGRPEYNGTQQQTYCGGAQKKACGIDEASPVGQYFSELFHKQNQ